MDFVTQMEQTLADELRTKGNYSHHAERMLEILKAIQSLELDSLEDVPELYSAGFNSALTLVREAIG